MMDLIFSEPMIYFLLKKNLPVKASALSKSPNDAYAKPI